MTAALKVCIVSKATALGGGASRVAEELAAGLIERGHKAVHLPAYLHEQDTSATRHLYGSRFRRLIRATHDLTASWGMQEILPLEYFTMMAQGAADADVVHFHDICAAASPLTIALAARRKPVAWTFHDCSPFTGGCLYPNECRAFETGCAACPQAGVWPLSARPRVAMQHRMRRAVTKRTAVRVLTPSRWMRDMAARSKARFSDIAVVPNAVDTETYRPMNKDEVKRQLDLPVDGPVALVSASLLSDKRKGVDFAFAALETLGEDAPHALVVGNADNAVRERLGHLPHTLTGYIRDKRLLAQHYAAADMFLFPSLAENQPLSILEAMAAGTPTVAFDSGGIGELVEHEETGWLAPAKDIDVFAEGIQACMNANAARVWGEKARRRVTERHAMKTFVDNHLAVYRRALAA